MWVMKVLLNYWNGCYFYMVFVETQWDIWSFGQADIWSFGQADIW